MLGLLQQLDLNFPSPGLREWWRVKPGHALDLHAALDNASVREP